MCFPNKWNNVTFDKCRDELEDITVNWGHSTLFVSYIAPTSPLFNSILNTVCFLTFNIFIFENCIAPERKVFCCNCMLSDYWKGWLITKIFVLCSQGQGVLAIGNVGYGGGRIIQIIFVPPNSFVTDCNQLWLGWPNLYQNFLLGSLKKPGKDGNLVQPA